MTDPKPDATASERPHRLLVVDDNEQNRDMLSRRLARRGYLVDTAEDGETALETIENGLGSEQPIDLVLLDIMMPGIDGLEVLRRLRTQHRSDELPVIMATARGESEDVVGALELGANDYVTKPIDFPVVLARVQKELRALDGARISRAVALDARTQARPLPPGQEASEPRSGAADGVVQDREVPDRVVQDSEVQEGAAEARTTEDRAARAEQRPAATEVAGLGPGLVIDGRYRLDERIGRGNFGVVYKGRHLELSHDVAVKILQSQLAEGGEALARFRVEGQSAVRVQHPNAVTVYDFGVTEGGLAYLVMELLSGEPLADQLERHQRLHPHRVRAILDPVCAVLEEAHSQGLIHRDIKPENVFLQQKRGREVVKVLDFGIAKLVGEHVARENLTAEGFVLGTPAYMAPERLRNRPYDGRSDVYSLGIMLFQMLTGRLPFEPQKSDPMALLMMHVDKDPPKLSDLVPSLDGELERLVDRCLSKEAADRPSAAELAERVGAAVEGRYGADEATVTSVFENRAFADEDVRDLSVRFDEDAVTERLQSSGMLAAAEERPARGLLGRLFGRFSGSSKGRS